MAKDDQQHIINDEWAVYDRVCGRRFDELEGNIKRMLQNGITTKLAEAVENSRTARRLAMWAIGTMVVLSIGVLGALGWIASILLQYVQG